jgi:two-component system, NtrC family, sensor kinase
MTMDGNSDVDVETLCALGQLIAGAAHKLNNNLTSVRGYTELIHEDLHSLAAEDERAASIAEEADILKTEVHNTAKVISLLADFGRKKNVHPVEDPATLLDGVVMLAGYNMQRAGCAIAVEADQGLPVLTESATALRRILLFVLLQCDRALEGRTGGSVRIAMRAWPQRPGVRVSIDHDGSGASDDHSTRGRLEACSALATQCGGGFAVEAGAEKTSYVFELPA